ncbi:MAG TPA: proprotein convertase P-domain-containing protein, partial [archaeon]|nr:proprotein convertase P-domain-containing protein [archaeon]
NDLIGEVHADSLPFSGSLWDLRGSLGAELTDSLAIRAMKLQPVRFAEFLEDLLAVDENNTNVSDGTPHLRQICAAFQDHHSIESLSCPDGADRTVTAANATRVPIPDLGTASSTIAIADNATIKNLRVFVAINHTFIGDLNISLIAPSGRAIGLLRPAINPRDNLTTWFDNETATEGPGALDDLVNQSSAGTWTLRIEDEYLFDDGNITNWSLWLRLADPRLSLAVTSPENRTYASSAVWANLTANASWCGASLDGAANATLSGNGTQWSRLLENLSAGHHTVRFSCNDTAGFVNATERAFTVDLAAPSIAIIQPADALYENAFPLAFNVTDDAMTQIPCWYWYGSSAQGFENRTTAVTVPNGTLLNTTVVPNPVNLSLSNGRFTANVTCGDALVNTSAVAHIWFARTAPFAVQVESSAASLSEPTTLSAFWMSGNGTLASFIFSTNATGAWANESPALFAGSNWSNFTRSFNSSSAFWRVYANNSGGKWGGTGPQAFVPVERCSALTGNRTLSADVSSSGACFTIAASDLTLDCAGHSISMNFGGGTGNAYAIKAANVSNIGIKNCRIEHFGSGFSIAGIRIENATNITLA